MQNAAQVDAIFQGKAYGDVARVLLNNNMDPAALRTNATLRKDEWKQLDEAVVQIARQRLVGVSDLVSRGHVYNIANGLGTTVLETENISDMTDAQVNMDAVTRGENDRVEYDIGYLPLPIIHKDFTINIRALEASRSRGQALDTTQAEIAASKVAEMAETLLFTGGANLTFGQGTIYGYLDYTNRNTVSLAANWDDSGATPLVDVLAMKQASLDARYFGPWILYTPANFETVLDEDYSAAKGDNTVRERLLKVGGIVESKTADFLTADNVLLVPLASQYARIVMGMQPTTLEWTSQGGMVFHYKVMAIIVPQLRADQESRTGLVHAS